MPVNTLRVGIQIAQKTLIKSYSCILTRLRKKSRSLKEASLRESLFRTPVWITQGMSLLGHTNTLIQRNIIGSFFSVPLTTLMSVAVLFLSVSGMRLPLVIWLLIVIWLWIIYTRMRTSSSCRKTWMSRRQVSRCRPHLSRNYLEIERISALCPF